MKPTAIILAIVSLALATPIAQPEGQAGDIDPRYDDSRLALALKKTNQTWNWP